MFAVQEMIDGLWYTDCLAATIGEAISLMQSGMADGGTAWRIVEL